MQRCQWTGTPLDGDTYYGLFLRPSFLEYCTIFDRIREICRIVHCVDLPQETSGWRRFVWIAGRIACCVGALAYVRLIEMSELVTKYMNKYDDSKNVCLKDKLTLTYTHKLTKFRRIGVGRLVSGTTFIGACNVLPAMF
jgi:hypothetical protein